MVLRSFIFLLISGIQSFSFSKNTVDINNIAVHSQEGKENVLENLMANESTIVYINYGFCIGCVNYLIDSKLIKKVVLGIADFSILHISQSSALMIKQLYFTDNSFFPLSKNNNLVLFIKEKNTTTVKVINYHDLVRLSDNFERNKKLFIKDYKKFIKNL
jgi:hypothetical protein